ncbi:MAG: hypothetical protein RR552_02915 [Oscillospiraceae bacterium]
MNTSGTLPATMVTYLKSCAEFNNIDIFVAYDNSTKPVPIVKPIVTVCTKGVEISEKVNQTGADGKVYVSDKRNVKTTISIAIHMPYEKGANEAFLLFDKIYSKLLFVYNTSVLTALCTGAEYIREYGAIVLNSELSVAALVSS